MKNRDKEKLLTKEDLQEVSQHRFFVVMTMEQRIQVRKNMEEMKERHDDIKLNLSKVLRKVMLDYMNDDEFLKYIGLIE